MALLGVGTKFFVWNFFQFHTKFLTPILWNFSIICSLVVMIGHTIGIGNLDLYWPFVYTGR